MTFPVQGGHAWVRPAWAFLSWQGLDGGEGGGGRGEEGEEGFGVAAKMLLIREGTTG